MVSREVRVRYVIQYIRYIKRKYMIESGFNSGEDTPVPISNTEVKLSSAQDTWRETAWESRTKPVSQKRRYKVSSFFIPAIRILSNNGETGQRSELF